MIDSFYTSNLWDFWEATHNGQSEYATMCWEKNAIFWGSGQQIAFCQEEPC